MNTIYSVFTDYLFGILETESQVCRMLNKCFPLGNVPSTTGHINRMRFWRFHSGNFFWNKRPKIFQDTLQSVSPPVPQLLSLPINQSLWSTYGIENIINQWLWYFNPLLSESLYSRGWKVTFSKFTVVSLYYKGSSTQGPIQGIPRKSPNSFTYSLDLKCRKKKCPLTSRLWM